MCAKSLAWLSSQSVILAHTAPAESGCQVHLKRMTQHMTNTVFGARGGFNASFSILFQVN